MADQEARIAILLVQVEKTVAGFSRIERAVESLGDELRELNNKGQLSSAGYEKARKRLAAVTKQARVARAALGKLKTAGPGISGLVSKFGLLRGAIAALGIAVAVRRMTEFVKAGVDVKNAFDSVENTLRAVTDTTAQYDRAQSLVLKTSKRLGLSIVAVGRDYAQLVAATKELELSQRDVEDVFVAVAEAGRVLNLSQQRIQLTFLALSQIASKGILTLEELRRQLGDQIPGIVPAVAKAMGQTTAAFLSAVKAGKVLSEDALPAIAKAVRDLAGSEVQAASETLAANIGRLQTAAQLAQRRIIELNDDALKPFLQRLTDIIESSPKTEAALAAMVGDLIRLGDELVRIAPAGIEVARILSGALVVAFKTLTSTVDVALAPLKSFFGLLVQIADLDLSGVDVGPLEAVMDPLGSLLKILEDLEKKKITLDLDAEPVKIAQKEVADAIEALNLRLLKAQGKNLKEQVRLEMEAADERVRIAELTTAKLEREDAELGMTLKQAAESRARFREELDQASAETRKALLRDLLREELRLELEAADERADAFEDLTADAKEAAGQRLADSEALALRLAALEVELAADVGAALDEQLAKSNLTADQRLKAQEELGEKLVQLEAETADKLEEIRQEFEESIAEGKGREEAEQEASEKIIEIYKAEGEKRVEFVEKAVDDIIKLEAKRVKEAEKATKKLIDLEKKRAEAEIEGRQKVRDFIKGLAEGLDVGRDRGDGGAGERAGRLAKLEQELAGAGGDAEKSRELFQRITNLKNGLDELGGAAQGAAFDIKGFSEDALAGLQGLLGDESFQQAFNALSQQEQDFARRAIDDFRVVSQSFNATEQDTRRLLDVFSTLGLVGPKAGQDILQSLEALGQPTGADAEIDKLHQQVTQLSAAAAAAASGATDAAAGLGDVATKADQASSAIEIVSTAAGGIEIRHVEEEAKPVADALGEVAEKATGAATGMGDAGEAAGEIATNAPPAAEGARLIAEAFGEGQPALEGAGTSLSSLAESLPAVQAGVAGIAEKLPAILAALQEAKGAETLATVAADVQKLAEATGKNQPGLEAFVAVLEALVGADSANIEALGEALAVVASPEQLQRFGELAKELEAAAAGTKDLGEGSETAQEALGNLRDFVADVLLDALGDLERGLSGAADELGGLGSELGDLKQDLAEAGRAASAMGEAVVAAAQAAKSSISGVRAEVRGLLHDLKEFDAKRQEVFG